MNLENRKLGNFAKNRKLPYLNPCNSTRSGHQEVGIPLYTLEFYALSSHITNSEKNFGWAASCTCDAPLSHEVGLNVVEY